MIEWAVFLLGIHLFIQCFQNKDLEDQINSLEERIQELEKKNVL